MKLIDTHAHIYLSDFDQDREEMIGRCLDQGIEKIFMPNIDVSTIDSMLQLEIDYPDLCVPMMGLHPGSVKGDFEKDLKQIETWIHERPFAAIGEIGLDFYWDLEYKEQQLEALSIQLDWAHQLGRPVVLHTRNSFAETRALVAGKNLSGLRGVFHCFGGSVAEVKQVSQLNFHLGLGGISTFKNSGLDQVIPEIPLDRILLETDSPYLAPAPNRGKRNEPSYLPLIAQRIADYKNISVYSVAGQTSENANELFA